MTDTKTPQATKFKNDLQNNPATHYWLIKRLDEVEEQDAVDAVKDVKLLLEYTKLRLKEIQEYYK